MSTMSVRLSDSLHARLREYAKKDDISFNQFVNSAITEKLAALSILKYLEARAELGNREQFENVLRKVPDVDAAPGD